MKENYFYVLDVFNKYALVVEALIESHPENKNI